MADDPSPRWRRVLGEQWATVRMRTAVAAVVIVGAALVLAGVALVVVMRATLVEQLEDAARSRAAEIASADAVERDSRLDDVGDDGFVQIVDASGAVVASSRNIEGTSRIPVAPGEEARQLTVLSEPAIVVAAASDDGVVVVGQSADDVAEATAVVIRLLVIGIPVLLGVVAATTWAMAGRALAPVEAIRTRVDTISAAELHRRVPDVPGGDEVSRLARTMNRMLDRLERAQARQREFVSDASHELRSPVASIRQHAEVALAHPERTTVRALAKVVLSEDLRVQRMVEDLLLLTRVDEGRLSMSAHPVDVDDLVLEEANRLRDTTHLRVDTSGVSAGRVTGDEAALRRVLRNLGDNAARHAKAVVTLRARTDDGVVAFSVEDDGAGIAMADRARVMERFVRLDEARDRDSGGAGLGLAIVDELVRAHGGVVEVADGADGGARFVVRLPRGTPD